MLIYCPKCNACYDIDETLIPEEGKKLRCARCGEVFLGRREDLKTRIYRQPQTDAEETPAEAETAAKPEEKTTPPQSDLQDIFQRLSAQTETLFTQDQKQPFYKKIWPRLKKISGLHKKENRWIYAGVLTVLSLLALNYFRYDIVRKAPFMESVYAMLGIESRIPGEGLEFSNIVRNEYEEDFVKKLEVKGFIINKTGHKIKIPTIHVEMLDREGRYLHGLDQPAPVEYVAPRSRVAFSVIITKPSPITKYVYLTFVGKEKNL